MVQEKAQRNKKSWSLILLGTILLLSPQICTSFVTPRLVSAINFASTQKEHRRHLPSVNAKRNPYEEDNKWSPSVDVDRRRAFQILGLSSIVMKSSYSMAAIPTMDDYESTSNGYNLKKSQSDVIPDKILKDLSLTTPIESQSSVASFIDNVTTSLNALDGVVASADWAGVRSVLRGEGRFSGNALSISRKNYFGIKGGEKGLKKVLGCEVKELEDARQDFAFLLAELEDFALENRSIFFNSLDRKEVDELIAESGFKEKVSEGKDLLLAAKKGVKEFRRASMDMK